MQNKRIGISPQIRLLIEAIGDTIEDDYDASTDTLSLDLDDINSLLTTEDSNLDEFHDAPTTNNDQSNECNSYYTRSPNKGEPPPITNTMDYQQCRHLDFAGEQSAMEYLLSRLSDKTEGFEFRLLTSPKYHCELAGEGVEYCWGLAKRFYKSKGSEEKRKKVRFNFVIRESIQFVRREHVETFSAKCRQYMIVYNTYDGDVLTYRMTKRFVKIAKCHCNIADQDKEFVEKAWKEVILTLDEN